MGFLAKLLGLPTHCPACQTPGAKVGLFGGVKCVSPDCLYHDAAYTRQAASMGVIHWSQLPAVTFDKPVTIQYVNAAGEDKTFVGDRRSLRVRGRHLSVCVQPSGWRIALALERVRNLDELSEAVPSAGDSGPTPREVYVMGFHRRRGSTSALFESLVAKYPDF